MLSAEQQLEILRARINQALSDLENAADEVEATGIDRWFQCGERPGDEFLMGRSDADAVRAVVARLRWRVGLW